MGLLPADWGSGVNVAYVRPGYRGPHAAAAILHAGLRHYAALGFPVCAVNFESFNPEAAALWPRYFTPVCLSLMRMPENPYAQGCWGGSCCRADGQSGLQVAAPYRPPNRLPSPPRRPRSFARRTSPGPRPAAPNAPAG